MQHGVCSTEDKTRQDKTRPTVRLTKQTNDRHVPRPWRVRTIFGCSRGPELNRSKDVTRERPIRRSTWLLYQVRCTCTLEDVRETLDSASCALVEQECMSAPGAGWVHQQWYLAANPTRAYHPVSSETVSPPSSALINQTQEGSGVQSALLSSSPYFEQGQFSLLGVRGVELLERCSKEYRCRGLAS